MPVTVTTTETVVNVAVQISAGPQGPQGEQGIQGPAGQGVPTGGAAGQYLRKTSGTNYDTQWSIIPRSYLFAGCQNNASATTLSQNTPTKAVIPLEFINGYSNDFTLDEDNDVFVYTGTAAKVFEVTGHCSLTSAQNNQILLYSAINGTIDLLTKSQGTTGVTGRQNDIPIYGVFTLNPNSTFWIWVVNETSNSSVTIQDAVIGLKSLLPG